MSGFVLEFPQMSPDDEMRERKQLLLAKRGLSLSFHITAAAVNEHTSQDCSLLDTILSSARILELNEKEWYFLEEGEEGPFSPHNELEALHLVESLLRQLRTVTSPPQETLENLHSNVLHRLNSYGLSTDLLGTPCCGGAEAALVKWAAQHGVKSQLEIAVFEGTGRGAAAAKDLEPGDVVLEIPQELIISEDLARQSDMGSVLAREGLGGETMVMLWTMEEMHNPGSKFAPFFAALPRHFNTGLSFEFKGLQALQGTLLLQEILASKEHLRLQYDSLCPALSGRYPDVFPEDHFTWEQFLWASELWYSYGIKVLFPETGLQTCLVPMASLLNHSMYPHVTHFSKINPATKTLQLPALRSCMAGTECCLSYGPLSNQELLLFYGFIMQDNPYDTIPIELETLPKHPSVDSSDLGDSHMVRGTWLSRSDPGECGLPTRLIAALRILCLEESELPTFIENPRHTMIDLEAEKAALESLLTTSQLLLQDLGTAVGSDGNGEDWDVAIAGKFVKSQEKLLESVKSSCMKLLCSLPLEDGTAAAEIIPHLTRCENTC